MCGDASGLFVQGDVTASDARYPPNTSGKHTPLHAAHALYRACPCARRLFMLEVLSTLIQTCVRHIA